MTGSRPRRSRSDSRGSLSIEAAIALPGFLLVALLMLNGILVVRTGIVAGIALERCGHVVSLLGPLSDFAGVDGLMERMESGTDPSPLDLFTSENAFRISDLLVVLASDAALPALFELEYEAATAEAGLWTDLVVGEGGARWTATCESRLAQDTLVLRVEYEVQTPFGTVRQHRTRSIPLWMSGDGTLDVPEEENVWTLGNLERGRKIRTRFGGNLPMGYPVIASMRQGVATSIHSMDLSVHGWEDASEAETVISDRIAELSAFEGTAHPWGADAIDIGPGSIVERRLLLVVPTNLDEPGFASMLERSVQKARRCGIVMTVLRYQERPEKVDSTW